MYYTYILYSETLEKYYCGSTSDVNKRLVEHNSGKTNFTRKAKDWQIIKFFEFENKSDALRLENKVKARGCKRFLDSLVK
ncbi:MAG: GIY-YIG nuclease family protein [Ignavibacteria bacterium]|nr:GIY-YIG nuclease family protein [Ignavibacteria bacterium]